MECFCTRAFRLCLAVRSWASFPGGMGSKTGQSCGGRAESVAAVDAAAADVSSWSEWTLLLTSRRRDMYNWDHIRVAEERNCGKRRLV